MGITQILGIVLGITLVSPQLLNAYAVANTPSADIPAWDVDFIWLSPIYPSHQYDNGYDVDDYCAIEPRFESFEDFYELIEKAKSFNISIMLDMVFNHTSTYHKWFQKALTDEKKYMDYYIFEEGKDNSLPTNWQAKVQKGGGWSACFLNNHYQPRALTRFAKDDKYQFELATALATLTHMMRGTPYIYQGEELGMTNPKFDPRDKCQRLYQI